MDFALEDAVAGLLSPSSYPKAKSMHIELHRQCMSILPRDGIQFLALEKVSTTDSLTHYFVLFACLSGNGLASRLIPCISKQKLADIGLNFKDGSREK